MQRRQFTGLLGSVLAGVSLSEAVQAQTHRVELRAGDQKGGLKALLDAAGESKGLPYDIKWSEFPAAAPLAEALNARAIDFGVIGDAPLLFDQIRHSNPSLISRVKALPPIAAP